MSAGEIPQNMRVNDATGQVYFVDPFPQKSWENTTHPIFNPEVISMTWNEEILRQIALKQIRDWMIMYHFTLEEIEGKESK